MDGSRSGSPTGSLEHCGFTDTGSSLLAVSPSTRLTTSATVVAVDLALLSVEPIDADRCSSYGGFLASFLDSMSPQSLLGRSPILLILILLLQWNGSGCFSSVIAHWLLARRSNWVDEPITQSVRWPTALTSNLAYRWLFVYPTTCCLNYFHSS